MRLFSKRLTGAICAISKIFVKRWNFCQNISKEVSHKRIPANLGTAICFLFSCFFLFFLGGGLNACQDGLWH